MATFETPYVLVAARTMVDPASPEDVRAVNDLQDQLGLTAVSQVPFAAPEYEAETFTATREAVLALAKGIGGFDGAFGRREDVSPVRHLLGTAAGWGGLPESEAYYVNVDPGFPMGCLLTDGQGRPGRRVLVDLALRRGRLLPGQRNPRQRQQPHRDP